MDTFQFPVQFHCSLTECCKKSPFQRWICFRGCGISAKGLCSLSLPQSTHRTAEMSFSSLPQHHNATESFIGYSVPFSPLALVFCFCLFIFKDPNWKPYAHSLVGILCCPICILAAVLGQRIPRLLAQVGQVSATPAMWPSTLGCSTQES